MSGMYCIRPNVRCASEALRDRFMQAISGPPARPLSQVLWATVLPAKAQAQFGREITRFGEIRERVSPKAVVTETDILATIERGELSKSKLNFFLLPDCFAWVHWVGGHEIGRWFLLTHPDDTEYGAPPGSLIFTPEAESLPV